MRTAPPPPADETVQKQKASSGRGSLNKLNRLLAYDWA